MKDLKRRASGAPLFYYHSFDKIELVMYFDSESPLTKMINIHVLAHSHLPIYLSLSVRATEGFTLPPIGSKIDIPFKDWVIKMKVEKIEPRDGCINIRSASDDKAWIAHSDPRHPITNFWKNTPHGQILLLPR